MSSYDPYSYNDDPRHARADAAAAKARAKAMRPWYKKKRWWALGALVLVIVIAAVAGSGGGEDGDAEPVASNDGSEQSADDGDTRNLGLYPNRPDRQDEDHEANVGQPVRLSGYTTTVTAAELTSTPLGSQQAVIHVDVTNRDQTAQPWNLFDWRLQDSAGRVIDPTVNVRDDALGSGDLVAGGSTAGTVAFDAGPGTYYAIYKPDQFDAARGIWRIEVGP